MQSDTAGGGMFEAVVSLAKSLPDDVIARDKSGQFSRESWDLCAKWGFQGMATPSKYGGSDLGGLIEGTLAMEAMGFGSPDLGLAFGLSAQMWTVMAPLVEFGTESQKKRYLPGLCDGTQIACHALTEPGSGSDVFSLTTRARSM